MPSSSHFPTSNQYIVFWVEVIQNSQNINNNTSNVTVKVWIKRTNTGYETWGSGTVYTNIDGVQRNVGISPNQKITSTPMVIFHQDITVGHNGDGSKNLTTSVGITHDMFNSSNHVYNCGLTTIPRASNFTLSSNTVDSGGRLTGTITRASGSFTHNVYLGFGSKRFTLATGVATSFDVTIPMETLKEIPSAVKGQGNIQVVTYNGVKELGTKLTTFFVTAPSSIVPTYTSLTVERIDNTVPSSWGVYVQRKSKAKLTINGASGVYGSTISKHTISGGGYSATSSPYTTDVIQDSGNVVFTGIVTDSRGRTATKTSSVTVVPYDAPKLLEYTVERCYSTGIISDEGTHVKITPRWSYSTVNGKNTLVAKVDYKTTSATSWSTAVTISTSGNSYVIGGGSISANTTYDIRITINDAFETVTKTVTIPTAKTTMDFRANGNGISIGKVSESDCFEVDWNSIFNKTLEVKGKLTFNDAQGQTLTLTKLQLGQRVGADVNTLKGEEYAINSTTGSNRPQDNTIIRNFGTDDKTNFQIACAYDKQEFFIRSQTRSSGGWSGFARITVSSDKTIKGFKYGYSNKSYLHCDATNGAWGIDMWASDRKIKEDITIIDDRVKTARVDIMGLNLIKQIEHYSFKFKEGETVSCGYVAQQLEDIDPSLIIKVEQSEEHPYYNEQDPYIRQVSPSTLIPHITKALQEISKENDNLRQENNKLKEKLTEFEDRLKLIEQLIT